MTEKTLASQKLKYSEARFEPDVELDAYKFLGAYLGAMTALHFAILQGQDTIARDILDRSFNEDLNETFGVCITYL